jgi:hypothetical protein
MMLLELKYKFAKEDGQHIIADRIVKKAAHLSERLETARAIVALQVRRDHEEAIEMNTQFDKEKQDATTVTGPDSSDS